MIFFFQKKENERREGETFGVSMAPDDSAGDERGGQSLGSHSGQADKASQRANIIFHRVDAQGRLLSRPRRCDPPRFA